MRREFFDSLFKDSDRFIRLQQDVLFFSEAARYQTFTQILYMKLNAIPPVLF